MNKRLFYSLFIGAILLSLVTQAQQQQLDTLNRKFRQHREAALQEKLFLHIDREFYLTGETLWLKIYALDASFHKPVNVSKVAYVEILDRSNKALVQTKIELTPTGGHGSIFIPATLASGNYVVRAYTQWMRNFSPEFYFHKTITIVNPFVRPEQDPAEKVATKIAVEFFPEGGNLVAGHRSKVAFRLNGIQDEEQYSGKILNSSGDTVVTFRPHKFGLGYFYFQPVEGQTYSAVISDSRGRQSNAKLPQIHAQGYVMHLVDTTGDNITVRVSYTGRQGTLQYAYLFVHCRQILVHSEMKPLYPTDALFTFSKAKLPDGITHLTVFSNELEPVCERLYFKRPVQSMQIDVSTDQMNYSPRRKVSMQMKAVVGNAGAASNLSVSVFKVDSLATSDNPGIMPYLLLTSDLKGTIENPEYYFSNDAGVHIATDNLMLTHGWRKFNWNDIIRQKFVPAHVPEFRGHLVTGHVTNKDGSAAPGIATYLASPGKLVNLYGSRSKQNGNVYFELRDFFGSRKLILQTNTSVDSVYQLEINNPFSSDFAGYQSHPFTLTSAAHKQLKARSFSMQVQDIYFREEHEIISASKADSSAFYGKADQTFYLDDFTRFPVLEEVMREYVPGVLVRKRKTGFHFLVLDKVNRGVLPGDPLVLLDGVPIFNLNKMMAFDPLKIKKLDVVMRQYFVGPVKLPGIVSYATYQGDMAGFQLDNKSIVIDYEGLQLRREFYSPRYENSKQRNDRLPDQRSLLFWAPEVITGADGTKQIDFYTSDLTGTFEIVVEGISNEGKAASAHTTFSVRRADF